MNNDLISRGALVHDLEKIISDKPVSIFKDGILRAINVIDNAPTVSDRYEEGYAQGYIDGSTGADWKGGAENEK